MRRNTSSTAAKTASPTTTEKIATRTPALIVPILPESTHAPGPSPERTTQPEAIAAPRRTLIGVLVHCASGVRTTMNAPTPATAPTPHATAGAPESSFLKLALAINANRASVPNPTIAESPRDTNPREPLSRSWFTTAGSRSRSSGHR